MSVTSFCVSNQKQLQADLTGGVIVPYRGAVCSRVRLLPCVTACKGLKLQKLFYYAVIEALELYHQILHILEQWRLPMPESGDVDILNPNCIPRGLNSPSRRRVGLSLDFSQLPKRCKIESMNFAVNATFSLCSGGSNAGTTCSSSSNNNNNNVNINVNNVNNINSYQRTIMPHDLAGKLSKSKPVLVLDCRPFFAYNANHIQGAVNINCSDRFNRRRLQQGKCSLIDLVTTKEGKDVFKKRSSKDIVLYDERTSDVGHIATDGTLYLVLTVLLREGKQASILKGGLSEFQNKHEDLCKSCLKPQEPKPLYSPTTPIIEPAIETETATQILPFLYLGNERDAANQQRLEDKGITYVLNVTSHIPLYFEKHGVKYKRIPASDSGQQNLRQYFEEALAFIDEAKEAGATILVHCQAGVSRSATITIAYILQHSYMSMTDAYRYVKGKRSIISPNFNFMGQLLEFEQCLVQGKVGRRLEPLLDEVEL